MQVFPTWGELTVHLERGRIFKLNESTINQRQPAENYLQAPLPDSPRKAEMSILNKVLYIRSQAQMCLGLGWQCHFSGLMSMKWGTRAGRRDYEFVSEICRQTEPNPSLKSIKALLILKTNQPWDECWFYTSFRRLDTAKSWVFPGDLTRYAWTQSYVAEFSHRPQQKYF